MLSRIDRANKENGPQTHKGKTENLSQNNIYVGG